ncbi:MAG: uroporphyrinogen decarboxylase family protein [Mahellales bacterium]
MNERERFLNTCRFKPVDRVPLWPPLSIWDTTLKRWKNEGLTDFGVDLAGEHSDETLSLFDYLGCDRFDEIGIYYGFCPGFEYKVIEENDRFIVYRNHEGIIMKELKENHETSMPQFLEFPIKTREDYKAVKHRLTLNFEERFPKNWADKCKIWKYSKVPLRMWADREGGFFGPLRNLFGLENLLYTFYDDPAFIEEIMDDRADLMIEILDRILEDVQFDFFVFWEDMAFKNGPLLSPEMFKKFMVPRYKRVTEFLRSKGIDIIVVDSDGDITKLIPLWLEAGVNGILPFEVQCGMDVVKVRKEYGNDLIMIGGLDKRVLAKSKKEIDEEIYRVAPILDRGGYIPWLDHGVPPDVPFDNFLYFYDKLERVINGK